MESKINKKEAYEEYQEALDELCSHAMVWFDNYDYEENDCGEYVSMEYDDLMELKNPLQKLIDKEKPKRPLGMSNTHEGRVGNCPNCKKLVGENDPKPEICICGQRLDWSKAIENR